jgi:hypothetical protein
MSHLKTNLVSPGVGVCFALVMLNDTLERVGEGSQID